jgi:hypothetical protein
MADVRLTATNPEDSSVVPVACDASGRLLIEEQGQGPQGEQGPPGPKGDPGPKGEDGKDGDPFSGNFADDVTFGGSASFAGKISVDRPVGELLRMARGGSISYIFTGEESTPGTSGLSIGKDMETLPGDANVFIGIDGSATFEGPVSAATLITEPEGGGVLSSRQGGSLYVWRAGNSDFDADDATTYTSSIEANGSAEFAGKKAGFTAEGYLWCTTARGDTVMLDATSNGVGVWVAYTPTTRRDEIRDRLDANRGDTGEMPADTP